MSLAVYKSSAGSGKTFTLVKEYIKLAIKGKKAKGIKPILAMTFTNKAAAEMQSRILEQLHEISDENLRKTSSMLGVLVEETKMTEDEIVQRCKFLLHQILHDYSFFSISTIDKFSHKIIRTFASDLGLSQNFEVELNQSELLEEAIENLIAKAGINKELTKFLIEFAIDRIDLDKSWRIETELLSTCKVIFEEDSEEHLQSLINVSISDFTEIRKQLVSEINSIEKEFKELGQKALKIIDDAGIDYGDFQYGKTGGVPSYFQKINKARITESVSSRTLNAIYEDLWYSKSKAQSIKNSIDGIKSQLVEIYHQIDKKKTENISTYILQKNILDNFYATALINEVNKEYEDLKIKKNVLPISDFNKLIGKIVNEQEAPFIYERTGNHFSNFLIDEFQDTSRLQWQNLIPLIENSLATNNENLIVGDGKQAIYRWRGGEVEQFVNIPYIKGAENSVVLQNRIAFVKQFVKENNLGTNYRSLKNVVEFNNALFANIVGSLGDFSKQIFAELEQKYLPNNKGGYVEVQVYNDHKDTAETFDEFNIEKTISCIKDLIAQGYSYSDIAILGRSNNNLVKIVDAIREQGEDIPVISSEAMFLEKSEKVRLVNTYLKLLLEPTDHHEQLRMLYLLDRIHKFNENLFAKTQSIIETKSLENFELILNSLGFPINFIAEVKNDVYEIIEQAFVLLKLETEADNYLLGYYNEAVQYFRKNGASLSGFINYFEERKEKLALSIPNGIDAVQLLTIHKSKGLEFPVVIFPFADYEAKYHGRMWIDIENEAKGINRFLIKKNKNLEQTRFAEEWEEHKQRTDLDELNVLYVACTRAVQQLYIFTSNASRKMLNKLILPAIENMEGWENDFFFSTGSKEFTLDASEEKPSSKVLKLKPITLNSMHSYPEGNKFDYIFPLFNSTESEELTAAEYGEMVHETFARIIRLEDAQRAIEFTISKNGLSNEVAEKLTSEINLVLTNAEIKPFFNTQNVRTEVEYWDEKGKVLRMDRVVEIEGQKVVLDFKTGEKDETHHQQIKNYKEVLQNVYKADVKAHLVYTQTGEVVEVS